VRLIGEGGAEQVERFLAAAEKAMADNIVGGKAWRTVATGTFAESGMK